MLHPEEYKVEHGMLATNEQFGSGAEKKNQFFIQCDNYYIYLADQIIIKTIRQDQIFLRLSGVSYRRGNVSTGS